MSNKLTLVKGIFLFLLISCSSEGTNLSDTSEEQKPNEEINTPSNTEPTPQVKGEEPEPKTEIADIEEVLKEFPQGALSFLSKNKKQCIAEISTTESLKSMEKSLMEEGKILQEQMDYFTSCNVPGPPGIGIKEATSSLATEGVLRNFIFDFFCKLLKISHL